MTETLKRFYTGNPPIGAPKLVYTVTASLKAILKEISITNDTGGGPADLTGAVAYGHGAFGASGTFYYASGGSSYIRKILPDGRVKVIAGKQNQTGTTNGVGVAARFSNQIQGLCVNAAEDTLWVCDTLNHKIRKIDLTTNTVSDFAGDGTSAAFAAGNGTAAKIPQPYSIVTDGTNLYVTGQTNNQRIAKITIAAPQTVTVFAGSGTAATTDGTGASAAFNNPYGLVMNAAGTLMYAADQTTAKIRQITVPGAVVTTLTSGAAATPTGDTTNTGALGAQLYNLALSADERKIYFTNGQQCVRFLDLDTEMISTLVPWQNPTDATGGGPTAGTLKTAVLNNPVGITAQADQIIVTGSGFKIAKIDVVGGRMDILLNGTGTAMTDGVANPQADTAVNVWVVPSGGVPDRSNRILGRLTVSFGQTHVVPFNKPLEIGDMIYVQATMPGAQCSIGGVEFS